MLARKRYEAVYMRSVVANNWAMYVYGGRERNITERALKEFGY